jgi:hypothetical protein
LIAVYPFSQISRLIFIPPEQAFLILAWKHILLVISVTRFNTIEEGGSPAACDMRNTIVTSTVNRLTLVWGKYDNHKGGSHAITHEKSYIGIEHH